MKRIEITSPQIRGKAHLGIREITGWWSSKKSYDTRYKITEARLEDTVYFVINTSGVPNGTKINLQLYNLEELFFLDYLCPDTYQFNGKIETAETHIQNDYAIIELKLPVTWTKDVKEDKGKIELYWKVKCNVTYKKYLPLCKSDYLSVRYSDRDLYIKPSKINPDFPEFYDSDGSLLVVAKISEVRWKEVDSLDNNDKCVDIVLSNISETVNKELLESIIENEIHNLALVKLSSGYMVDNNGHLYTDITSNGTKRKIYFKEIYTTDGMLIRSFQGKNFSLPNGTTTVGIDQYRFFSQYGMKAKTLGLLKQVSGIWDIFSFFDILKMGIDDEKGSLPIPLSGADLIGMLAQVKFQEFDEIYEQYQDDELNKTKIKGLNAVNKWIKSPAAGNKYNLLEISHVTAGKALLGEFKTLTDLIIFDDNLTESEKDISILLRVESDSITDSEIFIIEAFFRK